MSLWKIIVSVYTLKMQKNILTQSSLTFWIKLNFYMHEHEISFEHSWIISNKKLRFHHMLNNKNLAIVKRIVDKIEFTIARFHCICFSCFHEALALALPNSFIYYRRKMQKRSRTCLHTFNNICSSQWREIALKATFAKEHSYTRESLV